MADINVYESIDVAEQTYQTTYIANVGESIDVTDSASFSRSYAILNEKVLLPFQENLIFNGEILQSHNRTEQRISWRRGFPDRRFAIKLVLETETEIAIYENKIHKWLKRQWAFPLWPLAETHTATITAGDLSISVDTTYAGYQMGGYAMIWKDRDTCDVVTLASVTDTTLNLRTTPDNTYTGSKYIMPCFIARCFKTKLNWKQDRAVADMEFRIERVNDVIDYVPDMVYDNKIVLKDATITRGRTDNEYDPDFAVLDASTGLFDIVSNSDYNIISQPYSWHCDTKQEAWNLRQLLHYINGQQKGVLIPTFKNEIQLSRAVASIDTEIYVTHSNIYEDLGFNDFRTYIAFRPSGSIIVRKVTDISALSTTEQKITIDAAAGQSFSSGDYLCWVDVCRLSDDSITFNWYNRGRCFVETAFTRIINYEDALAELYSYDDLGASDSADRIFDWGISVSDGLTVTEDNTVNVI